MSVYRRGKVWWFKFRFQNQQIRESAKTTSKTVARDAECVRRRELEMAVNRITKRQPMPLFSSAGQRWLEGLTGKAENTRDAYEHFVETLTEEFGSRLVCDIGGDDISALQRRRLAKGWSGRTVNFEIATLRQILKAHRLWNGVAEEMAGKGVRMLPERRDVGRAISSSDEGKLIEAITKSRSPALLPLLILSLDTGLRASEIRALRHKDLTLEWRNGVIERGQLTVPKSKTEAGAGRIVPLTSRVCAVLTLWLSRFRAPDPDNYVFPRNSVGVAGNARRPNFYGVDLSQPIGEWKKAWKVACKTAKVTYRWHDCRHTFITRLAENPNVSEETIRALAGHVSRKMLERYSHIRMSAKQAAIAGLDKTNFLIRPEAPERRSPARVGGQDILHS
jgi:integrase